MGKINNLTQSAPAGDPKRQNNQTIDPSNNFEQKRANRGGSSGMVGSMPQNTGNLAERNDMMINSFVNGYQRPMGNP